MFSPVTLLSLTYSWRWENWLNTQKRCPVEFDLNCPEITLKFFQFFGVLHLHMQGRTSVVLRLKIMLPWDVKYSSYMSKPDNIPFKISRKQTSHKKATGMPFDTYTFFYMTDLFYTTCGEIHRVALGKPYHPANTHLECMLALIVYTSMWETEK